MSVRSAVVGVIAVLATLSIGSSAFSLSRSPSRLRASRSSSDTPEGVNCVRLRASGGSGKGGSSRTPFVGGNWKCVGTRESVKSLVDDLNASEAKFNDRVEVVVSPPWLHVPYTLSTINPRYRVATQNVGLNPGYGAFTGEVSADMIKDYGIDWTIVGHSERREGFGAKGESSSVVAEKTKVALDKGLRVIPCIGEKKEDREAGKTGEVLSEQLAALKATLKEADWTRVVLAYEPVWAIGTGLSASPQQAQETHKEIRQWVNDNISPEVASALRILYGGSVKPSNAKELFAMEDIDGFLVGGAALKAADFSAILAASDAVVSVTA